MIANAAVAKATELDIKMNIAVVDAVNHLKTFRRMAGVWLGSIDIATKKWRTARSFDTPTRDHGQLCRH